MKLINLENKYILFYRITILFVISLALIVTIASGIYGFVKFSGILSTGDKEVIVENKLVKPDLNKFTDKYNKKIIPQTKNNNSQKKKDPKKDTNEDTNNKNVLFKQQAERLASLQKAFMTEQKKEFADLEFNTLKSEVLKKILSLTVPVFCDKYNKSETSEVCNNPKFKRKEVSGGTVLILDTIDITKYSKQFYGDEINYFETQYSFISNFLTNPKISKLYADGKITSPTSDSIVEFHTQFLDNNSGFWRQRNKNFKNEIKNERNNEMQKFKDRAESLKILMVTGGAFGIFILVMFFVIFYRIERNLNTISELNINMLENMKK